MSARPQSTELLLVEGSSLLARLDQLSPLALRETMVPAAALPPAASLPMERFLHAGRTALRAQVKSHLAWLSGPGRHADPAEQQRRFVAIRLRFNAILSQFDLFTEVLTQRSEHDTGVWLAGLDRVAADALTVTPLVTDPPPLICYLARGPGAAIRRARTRLPGGDRNPVGIIRVPRERMVGAGVASSLVHEVGHQGAALLGLVESLRAELARGPAGGPATAGAWHSLTGWISEVVADFWSVATLGVTASQGLLAVVSLPRYFVFRPSGDDPHPTPYLRLLISAAIGERIYPDPQWGQLADTWKALYPTSGLSAGQQAEFAAIEGEIPAYVDRLAAHRSRALHDRALADAFPRRARSPQALRELAGQWHGELSVLARQPPTLVLAVLGQARAEGRLPADVESDLISTLLRVWALRASLAGPDTRAHDPTHLDGPRLHPTHPARARAS